MFSKRQNDEMTNLGLPVKTVIWVSGWELIEEDKEEREPGKQHKLTAGKLLPARINMIEA